MDRYKDARNRVKQVFGKEDPAMEVFDKIVGLLNSGHFRISSLMLSRDPSSMGEVMSHLQALCSDRIGFLEIKFMLVEDGQEVEVPRSVMREYLEGMREFFVSPLSGKEIRNLRDDVYIWFYPR